MQANDPEAGEHAPAPVASGFERAGAAVIGLGLLAGGGFVSLHGTRVLGNSVVLFPMLYAAAFIAMLVAATMARAHFRTTHQPALAILSNIFGVSALFLVPYLAITPGVISANGFGLASTALWLWVAWHVAILALAFAYAIGEPIFARRPVAARVARAIGERFAYATAIAGTATIAAILLFRTALPTLGDGDAFSPLFRAFIEPGLLGVCAIVLVILAFTTRLRSTPSLWITILVVQYVLQFAIGAALRHGAHTVAWYVVFASGPACQLLYLVNILRNANLQLDAFAADKKSLIEVTLRDPLTNLLNRRGFDERFKELLAQSRLRGKCASIVLFDIDHFKAYNDAFGHPQGDEALKTIANGVVAIRPSDACCRIGGEEFAIVLGDTDASGATGVAERVRAAVMNLKIRQDPEFAEVLTVSIGTATALPDATVDAGELYARADKALYKAKRLGRNRIATHDVLREPEPQPSLPEVARSFA